MQNGRRNAHNNYGAMIPPNGIGQKFGKCRVSVANEAFAPGELVNDFSKCLEWNVNVFCFLARLAAYVGVQPLAAGQVGQAQLRLGHAAAVMEVQNHDHVRPRWFFIKLCRGRPAPLLRLFH